jgi:hypothetical protein
MFFITFKDVGDWIFGGKKSGGPGIETSWLPKDKREAVK